MKKFLMLALVFIMVFALVACGDQEGTANPSDNDGNQTNPPVSQDGNVTKPEDTTTKSDLTTLEGWLSHWSLTEEDLKPVNFTRLDKTAYSLDDGTIKDVGAYVDKALTDEEARAWVEKVISKLNSMAEEGKVTNIAKDGGELTTDYIMGLDMRIASGTFTYKGKRVSAIITVMPKALDDADPDEAMPACSLGLQY